MKEIDSFLAIGRKVKELLPNNVRLVANIGDFNDETALKLKEHGFTGAHVGVMAVMRRIPVKGVPLEKNGQISRRKSKR